MTYYGKTPDQIKQMFEDGEYLTDDEINFMNTYDKYYPATDTDCVMNKVCHYIESINFDIKKRIRSTSEFDYKILFSNNFNESSINKKIYYAIEEEIKNTFKFWQEKSKNKKNNKLKVSFDEDMSQEKFNREAECISLRMRLDEITSNEEQLTNHLIYLFYVGHPSYSKSTLWQLVGKQIYENIKNKTTEYYFPVKDENGSLKFLYENYQVKKININDEYSKNNTNEKSDEKLDGKLSHNKNINKINLEIDKTLDKNEYECYNIDDVWE